ncbi:MAG: heme exporter protein CcmD [Acidiferrobacterales bacterium]|nr:heme exporter protein CcmD [Acidiferrobacterales bacterium]
MSFAEFVAMGGHGKFVWSAYGITFAVLAINLLFTMRRLRKSQRNIDNQRSSDRPDNADH